MKDKNKLLQVLQQYNIDELWVNFDDSFGKDHESEREKVIIVKHAAYYGDSDLHKAETTIMTYFAPKYASDEEDDVNQVQTECLTVNGMEELPVQLFNKMKGDCHLLYKKEAGLL